MMEACAKLHENHHFKTLIDSLQNELEFAKETLLSANDEQVRGRAQWLRRFIRTAESAHRVIHEEQREKFQARTYGGQ